MNARASTIRRRPATTPWWAWLAGALAVVGAIGIGLYLARSGPPAVSEMPGTSKLAPATATPPASTIQHPIGDAAVPGDTSPLPALDASDAAVLAALGALTGDGLTALMNPEHVIQRIVATVDSLPRQKIASDALPVRGASGTFAAHREATGDAIDAKNYARYDTYAAIAKSMDAGKVVAWYVHYYPLFQASYRELGYPDGYFNDRLVAVIDHLLETPDLAQPPALTQSKVMYEYADPSLESRSAGQKLLLRSGPDNEAAIKAKLREIRAVLTSQKVPPPDAAAPAANGLAPSEPAYLGGGGG
ncbi:MAG TPA: DUF3014 domain-containing protein [Rhodanobacteraceae bacterium]|nr:DUF3014 domain-containing protein [Rhodanobacteraceae bacterium]